ncbi:MAG: hypothetical protein IJ302_02205 [Clostridia bacterium]|nr:hypothetical protein [Clostridia bacterium]
MNRKTIAGLIAFLTLAGCAFTSCGDAAGAAEQTDAGETGAGTEAVTETAEPDPFADFDYAGEQVRIWTSTNDPGGVGNSNYLIEGPEEETGDVVADSAFIRNRSVEELLNVDLVFTQLDNTYETCGSTISKVIMECDDAY